MIIDTSLGSCLFMVGQEFKFQTPKALPEIPNGGANANGIL